MVKNQGLKKEAGTLLKSIRGLLIAFFIFGFFLIYSYLNLQTYYTSNLNSELLTQKGFDVYVTVQDDFFPVIIGLVDEIYACEGGSLDIPVRVITTNGAVPSASLSIYDIFYILFYNPIDSITNEFRLVSATLSKN